MMKTQLLRVFLLVAIVTWAGCGTPGEEDLRESFAQQVASISFVRDFQRNGDELGFSGPYGAETDAKWRVLIESAVIEPQDDEKQPYKGTITSSWYVNGRLIQPRGSYSDLPSEFLDKGVSQHCWAFWEKSTKRWGWV
jgi:hypothetical protein